MNKEEAQQELQVLFTNLEDYFVSSLANFDGEDEMKEEYLLDYFLKDYVDEKISKDFFISLMTMIHFY